MAALVCVIVSYTTVPVHVSVSLCLCLCWPPLPCPAAAGALPGPHHLDTRQPREPADHTGNTAGRDRSHIVTVTPGAAAGRGTGVQGKGGGGGASCCTCTACAQLDAAPGPHVFTGSQVASRGAVGHIVVCACVRGCCRRCMGFMTSACASTGRSTCGGTAQTCLTTSGGACAAVGRGQRQVQAGAQASRRATASCCPVPGMLTLAQPHTGVTPPAQCCACLVPTVEQGAAVDGKRQSFLDDGGVTATLFALVLLLFLLPLQFVGHH